MQSDRTSEWFVPKFGPKNFRRSVGILFLPYTAIVTCFAVLGATSGSLDVGRIVAISIIYFLALGVSAHLLDAIGGKTKPWGDLPKRKLWSISMISLGAAFSIGLYFAFLDSPLLFPIGIAEGFFLFAYNLEWFGGKFHNKITTIISWGILPVFAGSAIQTNSITLETVAISGITALITYVLIRNTRPYKILKQNNGDQQEIRRRELFLKILPLGVIIGTILFLL
ncbi:hypothetical protein [Nitrosopumilus sp. SJ]|uniref:hypothetical protein n=1 Tax=Nitrosopumilus sp. SJ TaxID=1027374 RepID=UPI000373955E|nr:hypothetical protein [Nitrosopumilus sp. SJ]